MSEHRTGSDALRRLDQIERSAHRVRPTDVGTWTLTEGSRSAADAVVVAPADLAWLIGWLRADITPPAEVGGPVRTLLFCRECAEGKHRNCDGTAWSNEADAVAPCTCPDPKHMSSRAASAIADLVVGDAERRGL